MSMQEPRAAMARAFRETALSLIGLYRIYDVDRDLADATAEALGRLFRRHLRHAPEDADGEKRRALHALVEEMDRAMDG